MPDSEEMPLLRLDLAWRKNEISFLATLGEVPLGFCAES